VSSADNVPEAEISLGSLARREPPLTRIAPRRGWAALGLAELWAYRELLYFLVWRDIKVRYKQTAIGAAWAILQPLVAMLVFSLFFGRLAGITPPGGVPYWAFAYAGLVPWTLFATGLSQASDSLVGSANLIRKVYFPRLAIPVAAVLASLVDGLLALAALLVALLVAGYPPGPGVLLLPLFLLLTLAASLGAGLWLSALNVQYRDVRYTVPFLVQIWLFATPVVYPSALIKDETLRALYGLNPLVGAVEGFRWALLGGEGPGGALAVSALAAALLLVSGALYFRHMEQTFADVV
jgi:lipopolysaccharide transport system permease protein